MRKIDIKTILKDNWIHLFAIFIFFITTFIYFQPQFNGYGLKQADIVNYKGAAQEISHFRKTHDGKEPLWTNSMFGGMPTFQISLRSPGNLLHYVRNTFHLWLSSPAGLFFPLLIGFYILGLCMKVDPKLSIIGSFAYAFSTYFMIFLYAGHNSKVSALGFAPLVIGAFYVAYHRKLLWGILLSALFMGLELYANHPQITYYLGFIVVAMGIGELIRYIKQKSLVRFIKISVGLILAYGFALGLNYGRLFLTKEYSQHTIRGKNEITIHPDGTSNKANSSSGLDKDYITQWSYGIDESLTLVSPYIMGSASVPFQSSHFAPLLRKPEFRQDANLIAQSGVYWGNQPFTSGPAYAGIIIVFLAILGLVYLKGIEKWALLGVTILALLLAWGKNFMGLTDFFIDYVPLYNKFRAVSTLMVVVELTLPLLAMLFLNYLFKNRSKIKENIQPFYITSGIFIGLLFILTYTGLGNGYLSNREKDVYYNAKERVIAQINQMSPQQLKANNIDLNNKQQIAQIVQQQQKRIDKQFGALINIRQHIYRSSMWRSIGFLVLGILIVLLIIKTEIKKGYLILALLAGVLLDLVPINLTYLNNKKSNHRDYDRWVKVQDKKFPLSPTKADLQILKMETKSNPHLRHLVDSVQTVMTRKRGIPQNELWVNKFQTLGAATDYRVYNPRLGFNSSKVSYFHKALNGYHGAKLRKIQNVKDFYINYNNIDVYNMLNVKYFIQGDRAVRNPEALGPVWLVNTINVQPTANKELLALGTSYLLKNLSTGKLLVNNNKREIDTISGRENVALVLKDTIPIALNSVRSSGVNSSFVMDINGATNWVPTEQLKKDTTNSFKTLVRVSKLQEFQPRYEAILNQKDANKLSSLTFSGKGKIQLQSYAPNKMVYNVNVSEKQFAVFSEIYYPDGWNAYIDGKKVPIYRADYLLRGIELPVGEYTLTMKFEVPTYTLSNKVEFAGSLILFLLIIGAFVKDFLLEKKTTSSKNDEAVVE